MTFRSVLFLFVVATLALVAGVAFAQDAPEPGFDWWGILVVAAPIAAPILTGILKRNVDRIPKVLLAPLATLLGAIMAGLGGADPSTAVAIGGLGVAARETGDQLLKLGDPPSKAK